MKVTALWNVKRMPSSLLGAAELSSPEHVEYAARFSTKSTGAEAITARVNVVVEPLSLSSNSPNHPLYQITCGIERDRNNIDDVHHGRRP